MTKTPTEIIPEYETLRLKKELSQDIRIYKLQE